MSENIYAQISNNKIDYIVDFEEQYGANWEIAKEAFEQSGLKFIKVDSLDSYNAGDIYNEESNQIISKPESPKSTIFIDTLQDKINNSQKEKHIISNINKKNSLFENNHSFLYFSTVNHGNMILNYGEQKEPSSQTFSSINPQFLPDGSFVCNSLYGQNKRITYNRIIKMSKDRKIEKQFNFENVHHECILGSNTPRYYTPEFDYSTANSNYLILTNYNVMNAEISDEMLLDDKIVELNEDGNILWSWACANHFADFEFNNEEKDEIRNNPIYMPSEVYGSGYDWMHLNSVCCLGDNKWYDGGDGRFHPDNLICCSRNRSMIFIVEKATGNVVWKLKGKDLKRPFALQHYAHLIPKGLEGAGNLLFFDNGTDDRDYSRIVELNPQTLEVEYEFTDGFKSKNQGSVQKLVNGEYLIGDSNEHMIIRVDKYGDVQSRFIVWFEFYRAIRHPESWFTEHVYTENDVRYLEQNKDEEFEVLDEVKLDAYENYVDQLIAYEDVLTNQLVLLQK